LAAGGQDCKSSPVEGCAGGRRRVIPGGSSPSGVCSVGRVVVQVLPGGFRCRVGAENSVTSCCLHVFVDDAAEPVSS